MVKVVAFGGSRSLPSRFVAFVRPVVTAVLASGSRVSVGCAQGADQLVLSSALDVYIPGRLAVFAIGDKNGAGFWSGSAPFPLLIRACAIADVLFLAGGDLRVPLKARLFRRSLATLAGASAFVLFLAQPVSPGSLRVAAAAVERSIPVFAFVCGFQGVPAQPSGCSGVWQPGDFFGFSCWRWAPAQTKLI